MRLRNSPPVVIWVSCFAFMLGLSTRIRSAQADPDIDEANSALAKANADATAAQANFDEAQSHFGLVVKGIRSAFEISPEYTSAQDAISSAASDSEVQRKKVLDQLHATPEYQTAKNAHDHATQEVADDREANAPMETIAREATDAMKLGSVLTEMEASALKGDAEFQADQKKLDAARKVMEALERRYKASLITNPDWQQAKADLDKARAKLTAAYGAAGAANGLVNAAEDARIDRERRDDAIRNHR